MNELTLDASSQYAPKLFSFISYRRESFGGFLFNPYLFKEWPLDRFEVAVVELCNGRTPVAVMPVELGRSFYTDRSTAERRLLATLDKLNKCYALKWRNVSQGMQVRPQDSEQECRRPSYLSETPQEGYLSAPLSIIWEITHACNLNCLHCLSACGSKITDELTTIEAKALIDELAQLNVFSIIMGGGEPLVRKDLFKLVEYITQKNLCIGLSTNGYDVTLETIRRLADLNVFSVQVSVDGKRDTHDFLRNRMGSFDRAVGALKIFGEAGYHTFMTVTATALNLGDVPALLDLAVQMGVSTFKVAPYVPLGRAIQNESKLKLSSSDVRKLAFIMHEKEQVLGNDIFLQMDGLFPWLLEPEPQYPSQYGSNGLGCSAGISQLVVSYDGEVYPCPYMRDKSAGNIRNETMMDIWGNERCFAPLRMFNPNQFKGKCKSCTYRPQHCTGGCRGAALAAHGDLYTEDPNCWRGE